MQAVIDRIAMIERVDNGLIVRYREPVETKQKLPLSPFYPGDSLPLYPSDPRGQTGETWKQGQEDDKDEEVVVWVLELRAVYCADEETVVPVLKKARAFGDQIKRLHHEGGVVIEAGDDGPGSYLPCR